MFISKSINACIKHILINPIKVCVLSFLDVSLQSIAVIY